MEYFTLNKTTYTNGTPINNVITATWIERYLEAGEFSLTVDASMANLNQLALGAFVSHTSTLQVMYIEEQSIDASVAGEIPKLTVSGRSLVAFFENRVSWPTLDILNLGIEGLNGELDQSLYTTLTRTNQTATTTQANGFGDSLVGATGFALSDVTNVTVGSLIAFTTTGVAEELEVVSKTVSTGAGGVTTTSGARFAHAQNKPVTPITLTKTEVDTGVTAPYVVPVATGALWEQVKVMLQKFLTTNVGTLTKYVLPNVLIRVASAGMGTQTYPPMSDWAVPWGTVYGAMLAGLQPVDCGIKIERPTSAHSTLDFIIHKGTDLSSTIQLSWSSGQIETARYSWSIKDYKNEVFVRTKYQGFMVPNVYTTLSVATTTTGISSFTVADRTGFVPGAKIAFNGAGAEQLTISSSYVPATGTGPITTVGVSGFTHAAGVGIFQNTVPTRTGWNLFVGIDDFSEYDVNPSGFSITGNVAIKEIYMKYVTEARGQTALSEHEKTILMDVTTKSITGKRYRADYNIGDIVYVIGDYGVSSKMRIIEHAEIIDENGLSEIPTLALV